MGRRKHRSHTTALETRDCVERPNRLQNQRPPEMRPSLSSVLGAIWDAAGRNQAKINEWGMNLDGGGYNFRLMRGSTRLSMHSWGCAVDFDPARNGFGDSTPNFENYPAVLSAFAAECWTWGGQWTRADGMHWQAADI